MQMKASLFCQYIILFVCFVNLNGLECDLRSTIFGSVCVCTEKYCDYLTNPQPNTTSDVIIVSSSQNGLRFSSTFGKFNTTELQYVHDYNSNTQDFQESSSQKMNFSPNSIIYMDGSKKLLMAEHGNLNDKMKLTTLKVNREASFQKVEGFGGAFTGSVSYILQLLTPMLQDQLFKTFFHEDGIGFNLLRMSIGGSDFDLYPWAYNEEPQNDSKLSNFTVLNSQDKLKVAQLKRMKKVANRENVHIIAAAWSPPPWMKTNNNWTGISELKKEFYQTWADYHLKYIELMSNEGMPIWAISTGNEPLNGVLFWFFIDFMSLGWTPINQAIWLSENLGPTLKNSMFRDVIIFANDDQRYTYPKWFEEMNRSRSDALDYLGGLAVHWYWDAFVNPQLLDTTHVEMPGRIILNTESCIGDKPWEVKGPELGSWQRAEQYMHAFMQDFKHSVNGWIDWNLVLNEFGGPTYAHNYVDAPIIVNTTNKIEFYKQPIFYAIGHFSKFVPHGSIRIETEMFSNNDLDALGFQNLDGTIAVIVINSGTAPVDMQINDSIRGNIRLQIPGRSMHTIIFK